MFTVVVLSEIRSWIFVILVRGFVFSVVCL